jgi:sensor histidine kinase YesM
MLSYKGSGSSEWFYTASTFAADDGNEYTCLVILPEENTELQFNLINAPLPVTKKFLTIFVISLLLFLLLFSLNIFLYSKWTAVKISRPLNNITTSLRELRSGTDTAWTSGGNEFLQICDAFNEMLKGWSPLKRKSRLDESEPHVLDISHD